MSYQAYIAKIATSPHPNADKLQVGFVCGAQVIVGLDTQDGELGVYFPSDGQLSKEFAEANDLVVRKDDQGNKIGGGYFDDKRRVRAQNFRGVKSEGFWVPLSYLAFTKFDLTKLKEGDAFEKLGDVPICNKYWTKATQAAIAGKKKIKFNVDMPEHGETTQFRFIQVPRDAVIHVTEKEHGTSFRYGNVMTHTPVTNKLHKFWRWCRGIKSDFISRREYVLGTRRAILPKVGELEYGGGFYGNGDPYTIAPKLLYGKLKDNEIIYGEVVGYLKTGSPLFTQDTEKLPEIKKLYGKTMEFSYGCIQGESRLRVYRIVQNGRDLTWYEVQARCQELGVETVKHMETIAYTGDRDALNATIATMLEGPSLVDERHMREGVCLRIESKEGMKIVKAKSWSFGVLEGYLKDNENYVDAEEIA